MIRVKGCGMISITLMDQFRKYYNLITKQIIMAKTINNKEELKENLSLLEYYLTKGSDAEKEFALSLIKRGRCFISYKINNQWKFAPSRFVGYLKNSMFAHKENETKDGKITNPVIDEILGITSEINESLENEYLNYCNYLGIRPNNIIRKYWRFF
jgi:5-methylcytosine-specific restriction protein A